MAKRNNNYSAPIQRNINHREQFSCVLIAIHHPGVKEIFISQNCVD